MTLSQCSLFIYILSDRNMSEVCDCSIISPESYDDEEIYFELTMILILYIVWMSLGMYIFA